MRIEWTHDTRKPEDTAGTTRTIFDAMVIASVVLPLVAKLFAIASGKLELEDGAV